MAYKRKASSYASSNKKSRTMRRAATTIQRAARKLIRRRRRTKFTRAPKRAMQAEKKITALTQRNERPTVATQLNAQASCKGFVIGSKPSAWGNFFDDMNGIVITKGDNSNQRDGQYVYLSHSNMFFNIDTAANSTTAPPMEIRVIVFKARRASNPEGVSYDPCTSLLLDDVGTPTGHSVTGVNGFDLTTRLTNKRDWYILRDQRFTLSMPYNTSPNGEVGGYSGKYPCAKNFRFRLPYNKKTRYNSQNLPEDCAYHWAVMVYCRSLGKDTPTAGMIEMNIRGQTVYLDP